MNKQTVAVLGSNGFVGENIISALNETNQYNILPITRNNNIDDFSHADIIIHSANPAKRFKAENNPETDFIETVEKTYNFFVGNKNKRFILISSMSARTQLYTNYGRNRRACELLIQQGNSLVIRLGPMFGGNRKEDMLHDILAGRNVYVAEDTQYSYVDVIIKKCNTNKPSAKLAYFIALKDTIGGLPKTKKTNKGKRKRATKRVAKRAIKDNL